LATLTLYHYYVTVSTMEEKKIITREEAKLLGLQFFYIGKICKNGHMSDFFVSSGGCVMCQRESYRKNIDHILKLKKEYREKNADIIKIKKREHRLKNIDSYSEKDKKYKIKNHEKIIERSRLYQERKTKSDNLYKFKRNIRALIRNSFNNKSLSKDTKTCQILGCSFEEFKTHIERQFHKGMSWENRNEWHIDHIVPVSSAKTEEEIILLNHFTNLRPLWAKDNLKKGAKMEYLL